ncbi:HaaA family cyclophane-containing RiPP peptide [Streptomyces achromogenes]|uniref:HaaA family cyclophane-containing RiPP peptide n=1 Tax=Streptomyces achromogenes TaxID=67255 RepID=UPI0037005191
MSSPLSATAPQTITPAGPASADSTPGTLVLDRVAARVRQRLEAEQGTAGQVGDGAHAASLMWPWPL